MGRLALITYLDGRGDSPDNTLPSNPTYPGNALPGGGYPSTGPVLPPGGVTLPVFPFDPVDPGYGVGAGNRPDNSLPGEQPEIDNSLPGGRPNRPSNELPSPGRRYIVKWLACYGLILVPDNSLPETAEPK